MEQTITTPAQIGELVRSRRKALGLSQEKLASRLNISQGRVSTLEGDARALPLERLIALAHLLGFDLVLRDRGATAAARARRRAPKPAVEW